MKSSQLSRLAGAGCALAAACIIAGCGSGGAATSASGPLSGPLSIEMTYGSAAVNRVVAAFEKKYPHVSVHVDFQNLPEMETTLPLALRAGRAPDIIYTSIGYGTSVSVQDLAPKGLLLSLQNQPWARSVPLSARTSLTYKGEIYAYPTETILLGGIYNPTQFAKLGLQVPSTLNQVLAICRRVSAMGLVPIATGGLNQYPLMLAEYPVVGSTVYSGNPYFSQQLLEGKATFAGAAGWLESLTVMQKMNAAGCYGSNALAVGWDEANQQFATGKAVMMVTGNSLLPAIKGYNPKGRFAMFPFPGTNDPSQTRVPFGPSVGLAIPSQAQHRALALRFLEFAAQTYPKYAVATGGIPSVSSDPGADVPSYAVQLRSYLSEHKTSPLYNDLWPNPEVLQTYMNGMESLLLGKSNPLKISKAMDEVWTSQAPQ